MTTTNPCFTDVRLFPDRMRLSNVANGCCHNNLGWVIGLVVHGSDAGAALSLKMFPPKPESAKEK
eukprot:1118539-Amphidinium_carterae.1